MNKVFSSNSVLSRIAGILAVLAVYLFLYTPLIIFFVFSFNNASFPSPWSGFTLDWYRELFYDVDIWQALYNSLLVAVCSVVSSTVMGLFFIFYVVQGGRVRRGISQFYANLVFPEIVLAVGLLGFFSYLSIPLGAVTLVIGHTVLGLGYVIPVVYSRYSELDYHLIEASLDLGASPLQTFFKITLPLLGPALSGAAILVFIISLDDFVLAYFCTGSTFQTLPLHILSMLRTGISPVVNALSTILLAFSSLLIILYSSFKVRSRVM